MKVTRWHKFCSLSFAELWLLIEAAAAVVAFDFAFRLFSAKTCLAFFKGKAVFHWRRHGADPRRLAWLIEVADRYAPGRSSCLRQSVALSWLLRRRGIATTIRIGVAREGENFVAHSWLQSNEGEVFGVSDVKEYALLLSLNVPESLRARSKR